MEFLKRHLTLIKSNIVLILGVAIFTFGVFSFSSDKYCNSSELPRVLAECQNPAAYYYYGYSGLAILVIGAVMITLGLLSLKNKNLI